MGKALTIGLCALLIIGCKPYKTKDDNCNNVACTTIFKMITITITDRNNQKVPLTNYYTVRLSNNDTLTDLHGPIEAGVYTVADDNLTNALKNNQEDFRFIGIVDNDVIVDEPYTIGADCCHINLVSGKTEIVIP